MTDRRRRVGVDFLALSVLITLDTGCGNQAAQQSRIAAPAANQPLVRVLLRNGHSPAAIQIRASAGLRVVDRDGTELASVHAQTTATVSAGPGGLRWNQTPLQRQRVELIPHGGEIELDAQAYRGNLRLIQTADDGVAVVNVLPIEDYLSGVLRGEMPRRFSSAAQRALVVAARTYALFQCAISPGEADFDLYAGERSQVYRGVAGEDAAARAAVQQTRGLVLTTTDQNRRIFEALYSSTCGGATLSAAAFSGRRAVAPLRGGVICDGCATAGSPFLEWDRDVHLNKGEVRDALLRRFPALASLGELQRIEIAERGARNRPTLLRIVGEAAADRTIRPEALRVAIGGRRLRSSWFEVESDEEDFIFTAGRGYGHGAGLCQYGAQGMAHNGNGTLQILAHYYPASAVVKAY